MSFENNQITAKVIADSYTADGRRLTTLELKYPRFIHAEFMTHRVFSRNAGSSRAIPVAKMIQNVRENFAHPIHWGKNQPGMQADEELIGKELKAVQRLWRGAALYAAHTAEKMNESMAHKQIANRILEPFQLISVVVTSSEWENFFELRAHPAAQPEIRALAHEILIAMETSTPVVLKPGQWHVPYVKSKFDDGKQYFFINVNGKDVPVTLEEALKSSAAYCARVSYEKHDGTSATLEDNIGLYVRLVGSNPIHASPVEHQATPDKTVGWFGKILNKLSGNNSRYRNSHLHGNFSGWVQHRKLVERKISPTSNFF